MVFFSNVSSTVCYHILRLHVDLNAKTAIGGQMKLNKRQISEINLSEINIYREILYKITFSQKYI